VIPLDRVRAMLATATPSPIDVHRCDAGGGDIDYQLQHGAGHGGTVLGYASDRDGSPRAKADATLWSHAPDLARDVLTLAAALETAQRERDTLRALTDSMRADNVRLRGIVAAVRHERAARAAWLATLPACATAPAEVVAAEAATGAALDAAGEGR